MTISKINRADALLPIISISTLTGFKLLSFAVRIMVIMIESLRFPHLVMLPKVTFMNKTAFLMPRSARLLVGKAPELGFEKTSHGKYIPLGIDVSPSDYSSSNKERVSWT